MITWDALIVTRVKHWLVACVCFGDGQTEAICGRTGKATGRIREGRRAGKGKKGGKEGRWEVERGRKECEGAYCSVIGL